jgi:glycosyltransferase involved in cell wall biosynthesis
VFYLPNGVEDRRQKTEGRRQKAEGRRQEAEGGMVQVREKYALGEDPVVLLYTRFVEFRVERVMEIFARVLAQMPSAQMLVVGKGLQSEETRLMQLAREGGLLDKIKYVGWVDAAELPDFFAAADVAIYPFDDTLINRTKCAVKLIDLLAAGVPVVADAVGQNTEYVEHRVSGWLVRGGTEEFARAVANLLRDEDSRRALGAAARLKMAREFAWSKLAETAERAYGSGS